MAQKPLTRQVWLRASRLPTAARARPRQRTRAGFGGAAWRGENDDHVCASDSCASTRGERDCGYCGAY